MFVHPLLEYFSIYQQALLPSSQQNLSFETNTYDPHDWAALCEFVAINEPVLLKLLKLFKFHLTSLCCHSPFLNPMHDFVRLASPTVGSFQM